MLIRRLLFTTLLAAGAFTGDDDPGGAPDARFSTLDEAHLLRVVDAMKGSDPGGLMKETLFPYGAGDPGEDTSCPTIATTGATSTLSGGCSRADDPSPVVGTIVTTNFPRTETDPWDPAQPSTIVADDYSGNDQVWGPRAYQGRIDYLTVDGDVDNGAHSVADVHAEFRGLDAHTVFVADCDGDNVCTYAADSRITVEGVGTAVLSGTWRNGSADERTGAITATGLETLVIDVDARTADCDTITIDGAGPFQVCAPPRI